MAFLNPLAWIFAALIPVIIALYMIRQRRRTFSVSTLLFWREALAPASNRRALGRIRGLLSLLLNLLIFCLLLLALSRPDWNRFLAARSTAVIIDNRARMQAADTDGTIACQRALEAARALIRRASEGNQIALLTTAGGPTVLAPLSGDSDDLLTRLEHAAPSAAGGDIDPAIAAARDILSRQPGASRIILITDRHGAYSNGSESIPIETIAVGRPAGQAGITRFAIATPPGSPQTRELYLEVENFSTTPLDGELALRLDGVVFDLVPLRLGPGDRRRATYAFTLDQLRNTRGLLTAELRPADALAIDNSAFAVIPPVSPPRVLLISGGNWFLEKLLAADDSIRFDLLRPDAWQPSLAGGFDLVIFDDWLPDGFDPSALEQANFLFIGRSPFDAADDALAQPPLTDEDRSHPVLRNVETGPLRIERAVRLNLPSDDTWRTIAPLRSADDPLILTLERTGSPARRSAIYTFRLLDSNLPLRVAFPLLLSNTIRWLSNQSDNPASLYAAGDAFIASPGEEIGTAPLDPLQPLGETSIETKRALRLDRSGFYPVRSRDGIGWIAVNTADRQESNLLDASSESGGAAILAGFHQPPWRWLLLAAFALLLFEWAAYHRRWTE
jgi:hypothetical protein